MIDFDELEEAFLFVSAGPPFINHAIVNKKTGKIFYRTDFAGVDDFPEDYESDDYVAIPHRNDLDLGQRLAFDFVANRLPDRSDEVYAMFHARGAYRRFKGLLESLGLLDEWYDFENERTRDALRQWCESEGLQIRA